MKFGGFEVCMKIKSAAVLFLMHGKSLDTGIQLRFFLRYAKPFLTVQVWFGSVDKPQIAC
jgi:hypothetical protein